MGTGRKMSVFEIENSVGSRMKLTGIGMKWREMIKLSGEMNWINESRSEIRKYIGEMKWLNGKVKWRNEDQK